MTFVHYSVPLSWAATAVCFTVAFRTLILPAVRRRSRPDSLPSTHHTTLIFFVFVIACDQVALTMQNSAKMRAVQPGTFKLSLSREHASAHLRVRARASLQSWRRSRASTVPRSALT
jgi:hypothetical protein